MIIGLRIEDNNLQCNYTKELNKNLPEDYKYVQIKISELFYENYSYSTMILEFRKTNNRTIKIELISEDEIIRYCKKVNQNAVLDEFVMKVINEVLYSKIICDKQIGKLLGYV